MKTDRYIPIIRHFRDASEDLKAAPERRLLRDLRPDKALTWASLIGPTAGTATVLLAASGTGKSTELRGQVAALRRRGVHAILGEAAAVADEGFRDSLPVPEVTAFDAWMSLDAPAVVVVDAVDEIHLRGRTLGDLTRRLGRALDLATRRVQLIVSARNGAWSREYTAQLTDLLRQATENPVVRILTFEPIDRSALAALVAAHGIADGDAFMRAFEEDELDGLLDLRPCDVELFVEYWRRHGRFGRWSDILADFVDAALEDTNRARGRLQGLSADEARCGLRRLGAASILTKTPHVAVPSSGRVTGAMSARRLFDDWPMPKVSELFENSLFVHKGAEAVQLPQGALTHFLAGRWFAERAARGAAIESLHDALLVRVHDETDWRIPISRRPIVGWACSEDVELREVLLKTHPDVVLYEGDPERLSDREIERALKRLLVDIASGRLDITPTAATVRKLAQASLAPAVLALLKEHAASANVQRHLLRFAELGRYSTCVEHALALALDSGVDDSVRATAVAVVAAAGDQSSHLRLAPLLSETSDSIRAGLLRALVRTHPDRQQAIEFLAAGGEDFFRYELRAVAPDLSVNELDAILDRMAPTLTSSTETKQTIRTFNAAIPLLIERIRRGGEPSSRIVELLGAIERLSEGTAFYLSREDRDAVNVLLKGQPKLRIALWRERLNGASQNANAFTQLTDPEFGELGEADLAWLFDLQAQNGSVRSDVAFVVNRILGQLGDEERQAVKAASTRADIKEHIDRVEAARDEQKRAQRAREEEQSRHTDETVAANRRALEPLRHGIETGDDLDALVWGWQHLPDAGTARYARIDVAKLATIVGVELVPAFVAGFKACWRRQAVELPQPGVNEKPFVYLAGLTGLTLEIRDGLDLRALSLSEAELAARYGLYELNALPYWFEDLVVAQPKAVANVLAAVFSLEWAANTQHDGVLRFASGAGKETRLLMRRLVLDLLEAGPPRHHRTIHLAVDAIIASSAETLRVGALIRPQVLADDDDDRLREWLRAWAHFAPLETAAWLEAGLASNAARFTQLVIRTAELLEFDFDERFGRATETALMSPNAIAAWARLLLGVVRPEQDRKGGGVYRPQIRDHAEDFRRRCIGRLARDTSVEGYAALRALRDDPTMSAQAPWLDRLLEDQARAAAEATVAVWTEDDVVRVERSDEKRPRTLDELFRLVRAHIRRIAKLLENDDYSYRRMFKPKTSETEIQLWAASSLKQVARGLYSVIRENAVDDDKEIDISAFADGVGRVPVEIKPLNKKRYSFEQLRGVIKTQLAGLYMQPPEVRHGILMLVLHEPRVWRIAGKNVELDGLLRALREHASSIGSRLGKTIAVEVVDAVSLPSETRGADSAPVPSKKKNKKKKPPKRKARKAGLKATAAARKGGSKAAAAKAKAKKLTKKAAPGGKKAAARGP